MGDTSPSKHRTKGGTAYRYLAVSAFPVEDRIPPERRPGPVTEEYREAYEYWLFLSKHSNGNKGMLPTLNYDYAMVVESFKNSQSPTLEDCDMSKRSEAFGRGSG